MERKEYMYMTVRWLYNAENSTYLEYTVHRDLFLAWLLTDHLRVFFSILHVHASPESLQGKSDLTDTQSTILPNVHIYMYK